MTLTNEDLKTIAELMDQRLEPINQHFDRMDNRLDTLEVWQLKIVRQIEELQVAQKFFELNTNKKLAKLQDGMDTVEEILKLNDLIPR